MQKVNSLLTALALTATPADNWRHRYSANGLPYATAFNAKRIVHLDDADSAPGSEIVLDIQSAQPVNASLNCEFLSDLGEQLTIIPTPGHTKGHMVLLYQNHFTFSWSFPGHGQRVHLDEDEMHN